MQEVLLRIDGPRTGRVLKSWLSVTVEKCPNQNHKCEIWIERLNESIEKPRNHIAKLIIWTRPEDIPWLIDALKQANDFMENYNAPPKEKGETEGQAEIRRQG